LPEAEGSNPSAAVNRASDSVTLLTSLEFTHHPGLIPEIHQREKAGNFSVRQASTVTPSYPQCRAQIQSIHDPRQFAETDDEEYTELTPAIPTHLRNEAVPEQINLVDS
jgi:hypothetical protein